MQAHGTVDDLYDFPGQGSWLKTIDFLANVPKVLILKEKFNQAQRDDVKEEFKSPDGQERVYVFEEYLADMSAVTRKVSITKPNAIIIAMRQAKIVLDEYFSLTWNGDTSREGSRFEAVRLPDLDAIEATLARASKAPAGGDKVQSEADRVFGTNR